MRSLRSRFTYSNVMSTLAVVLARGGATAVAASALPPNSVGTVQLQEEAVTAAKIRNGAVRRAKLGSGAVSQNKLAPEAVSGEKLAGGAVSVDKLAAGAVATEKLGDGSVTSPKLADGSVTSTKLADGSVTSEKLAPGVAGGPQIVHRSHTTATLEFPPVTAQSHPIAYPLEDATYTQPAGEDDLYLASMRIHIPASCTFSREAQARLFIDAGGGSSREFLGRAVFSESGNGGDEFATVQFATGGEFGHGIGTAAPEAPVTHTFTLELDDSSCEGNADVPSHITAVGAEIDVIGFR